MWRTLLLPTNESTAGADPSVGTSAMVAVFLKITTLEKSPPGLVQLTVTCPVPGVALAEGTMAGARLSMVTGALAVSVPDWTLLPVREGTGPGQAAGSPGAAGGFW